MLVFETIIDDDLPQRFDRETTRSRQVVEVDSFIVAKLPLAIMKVKVKHRHAGKNQQEVLKFQA